MCDSIADGGRRCATHTRPLCQAALDRVAHAVAEDKSEARAVGVVDVSAHASTRSGAQEIDALITEATEAGDQEQIAWLTTCRRLGDSQREAANEIRRAIQAQRTQSTLGEVQAGDVLYAAEGHLFSGDRRFNYIRRGTYLRTIGEQPNGQVAVEVLQFRPEDTTRARRGPRNPEGVADASTGQILNIPKTSLRRPTDADDTANFYRQHTVSYEGDYYTEDVANQIIRAEPDDDFHEYAIYSPREQPRTQTPGE